MEKIGRFKPGQNVSVFAKTAIKAGRFIAITAAKTSRGDYQGEHAPAGTRRPFGVSQYDSAPTTQPAHSRERLVEVMKGGIPFVEAGEEISALAEISVGAEGKAVAASGEGAAFLDKGVQADNNAVHYEANTSGTDGNDITVALLNTGKEKALSVDVDGNDITVTLATNNTGAGEVTSTAAQVIAAILEHDTASQLITASNKGTSTGAGVISAFAKASLSGGTAGGEANPVGKALTAAAEAGDYIEVDIY
jgi:hypothetical protein